MDRTRKHCIILTPTDLSPENINDTVAMIEHNPNCFYLLDSGWKVNLWEVVENLGKISDDENILTRIRIAYNLEFELKTELKQGDDISVAGTEVKSLVDLLELMEFDENLNLRYADYHVIIDDSDRADLAVTKLFQQMAFLSLDIDVRKKSVAAQEKFTRPIRVAAMGTLNAGKSVVINNLIKRDYAPTSLTIPTPNTIIKYIPAPPDIKLRLEYNGETIIFDSAESLKKFIGDEFKEAQKKTDEGSGLPNMTIYYPCDDLNGYEIWEILFPYFFFPPEYTKNVEECIEAVDVCIFVMSCAKHLTNDEICVLKTISKFLQSENKMLSIVFVVNAIDYRYNEYEEKSIPRILDYVRARLEGIGYENPVVFGTSALQGFYLDKVVELVKADRDKVGEDVDELPIVTVDSIRQLRRRHRDSMTQLSFVYKSLENLIDFHCIDNPTERELYALSGIPQLRRYVEYLGEQAQLRG